MINLKVSQLMDYIRNFTSKDYVLNNLSVEGEISNYNRHSNGRIYFSIKDDISKIDCMMNIKEASQLKEEFKQGDHVLVSGFVDVLERDGKLSLQAKSIEKFGLGKIHERFEKLREKLYEKGYFDEKHKQAIPKYPNKVGIITSATGAAIRDILKIAHKKNPYIDIELYPSNVQGAFASESLIDGLKHFEDSDVDVIILGRGGGAYEDLDSFNSEKLAMEVFRHNKPIVSAVGHAIDYVLTDYVADARAATPTEAADLVFFSMEDYKRNILTSLEKISKEINSNINSYEKELKIKKGYIDSYSPENQIDNLLNKLKYNLKFFKNNIINKVDRRTSLLTYYKNSLDASNILTKIDDLSRNNERTLDQINLLYKDFLYIEENKLNDYKMILDRHNIKERLNDGYSLVLDNNGKIIKNIDQVDLSDKLQIILSDGNLKVLVEEKEKTGE